MFPLSDLWGSGSTTGLNQLFSNTTGNDNTANGDLALKSNTTGRENTANGSIALSSNTTGFDNTAIGFLALAFNTTGSSNTAISASALQANTSGSGNTANGYQALLSNTGGSVNTANGYQALNLNTIGGENAANGSYALAANTTGFQNTANGYQALLHNTTGSGNTALGGEAGLNVTTADNVTCIAHAGQNASHTTWIGNVFGTTTVSGTTAPVIVSDTGQLGTMSSSRRFKKEIKPMDKASESVLALKPVTFHYKNDMANAPQFGLIAEEVADVNPDLVVREANGKIYTVRYDAVNAMLLNEFLKEHRTVQELKNEVAALTATIKEQAAQIQKVSAQPATASPSLADLN